MSENSDWTPAFPGQRPPFQPGHEHRVEEGNELAVTHGATAVLKLTPRADEISERIRAIVPTGSEHDEPTVRLLAGVLARIEAANEWLAEKTIFADKAGNAQPILKQLSTWENTAGRLCEKLGLTPTSRAELGLDLARMHVTVAEAQEFVDALRRELESIVDPEVLAVALERAARSVAGLSRPSDETEGSDAGAS